MPLECCLIYRDITFDTAITVPESESDIRIKTDSYGDSILKILEKIDRVLTTPDYIIFIVLINEAPYMNSVSFIRRYMQPSHATRLKWVFIYQ